MGAKTTKSEGYSLATERLNRAKVLLEMKTEAIKTLERDLGYEFKSRELITEALTHRSHHHEFGDSPHNERLEFLGDAVLDLCMTELVMSYAPASDEGELSKLRSQLVSERTLARAAKLLKLGSYVRLGRGEDISGGRDRDALLADTLEAVVAAVYLDSGMESVRRCLVATMTELAHGSDLLPGMLQRLLKRDAKSRLQELCQSLGYAAPTYECMGTAGPDHMCRFTMVVKVQNMEFIRADGPTKKEATHEAAREFLEKHGDEDSLLSLFMSRGLPPISKPKTKSTKPATRGATSGSKDPSK